jgi:hypothetical protein
MPEPRPRPEPTSPIPLVPEVVWLPLATVLILLVPGLLGLGASRVALFPSLGPTALTQVHMPRHPTSRFYNVVVSHLVGLGSAFLMVALFGLSQQRSVFEVGELTWPRVAASVLAVALAALLEVVLHASHPAAASTTLLVALGTFHPTRHDVSTLLLGILTVALAGEFLRRLRSDPPG